LPEKTFKRPDMVTERAYSPGVRVTRERMPWPLLAVLGVQAALSVSMVRARTAFGDEALYLNAGHLEWSHCGEGTLRKHRLLRVGVPRPGVTDRPLPETATRCPRGGRPPAASPGHPVHEHPSLAAGKQDATCG